MHIYNVNMHSDKCFSYNILLYGYPQLNSVFNKPEKIHKHLYISAVVHV